MSAGNASFSGNPTKQEHYHAFLSHNSADKSSVESLAEELEKRGLACWLDKWNLVPGDPWQPAIEEALGQCDTCVVFFGPHGLGPWHNEEMRLAIQRKVSAKERKLRVLPVILPSGERAKEGDLPGFLQGTTWVEFRRSLDEEDALYRLVCGIKSIPPGRRPGATILEGECPYLGLKTFQPEDAPLFFGRRAKVQELIARLRNSFGTPKEERFLALIGASGSGKSSLALAGLIPYIQRGELPASANWPLVRCRPGTRPWENLQIALWANQQIALHMAALPALIIRPEDEQRRLHLTAQLALHDQPENHRLFILIDQFEEIFTLCNDEGARHQLIDNVLYATNVAGGRTIVVLTMRADFYGQCASYPGLRAAIADHQSLIGPLSEEELREAIEPPAQLAGGELEPGLMELLLADMEGQAGALPFLEHALFKLWEMRDGRRLTAKAYTEMGRLGGALDAHAEEFFTRTLSIEEQSLCRQLLVDLVHPGEGAADTKKRVLLDDLAPTDAMRAVLKKLADARLVTTDRDDRPEAAQAELAHEALISGWRRLGEWVNENREKSRLKERLLDAAREWQKNSNRDDFLYRGAQLAIAEESFGSSGESLARLGREFLDASLVLKNRLNLQEEERKQRELDAAVAAEKRISEIASQANVSLARNSQAVENDNQTLAYLANALRLNPRNSGAGALTAALLTQESWSVVTRAMKHDGWVYSAQFSADGQRVVTASADKTAQVWDAARGKALSEPMKHDGAVYSAQFSADGQRVVTASADKTAQVWDAARGKALSEPMKHDGAVYSAQFSADGQRVVTASDDHTARIWDAATGKALGEPMKHDGAVYSAQFSADGQRVVTASWDNTARVWDAATGKALSEPMKHDVGVNSAQFSADGQRVVTASWDNTARVWDAATGKPLSEPMKHDAGVRSAQFSPDGQRVVTGSLDKRARVWDAATGKALSELMKHDKAVYSAEFSADGQRVVTASDDQTARVWDAATGKALSEPMKHDGRVNSAQFSADGQQVVTASWDNTARVWDAATGKALSEPMKHDDVVNSAQFSADGQRVVTASDDQTARVWDAATGKALSEPMKHDDVVYSAQFSADGQRVVTASRDKTARVWDAATGKALSEPMKHDDTVYSAQFSADGQRVVTASKTARVWDAATGKALSEPMKHDGTVYSAQFSADGQRVVTASKTARVWDAATGKALSEPMKHDGRINSAQFSADGQRVVTATWDMTARVWDAATGKALSEPMKHDRPLYSAQFSADGQRVVTASRDQTARVWDAATGKPLSEPMKHDAEVNSAQFSADGQRVVTASADKTARVWDAATGKALSEPMKHDGRINSAQFSADGQRVVTASADKTARVWDIPTITRKDSADDVNLLAALAEATGGVALQTSGSAEILNVLTPDQVNATREKITAKFVRKSSDLTPLQRLMKWSVSEWRSRTISPLSELTVPEWIENRMQEGTLDSLRAAMVVDPGNPRLAAHFGKALADHALEKGTDAGEARRARAEADYQAHRAVKLASDKDEVKKLCAEVVEMLKQKE